MRETTVIGNTNQRTIFLLISYHTLPAFCHRQLTILLLSC